jgi:hypothetical protein
VPAGGWSTPLDGGFSPFLEICQNPANPITAHSWAGTLDVGDAEGSGLSADRTNNLLRLYRTGEVPAKVYRVELATGKRTVWKQIAPLDPTGVSTIGPILMTPDGKTYVYGFHRTLGDLYLVEGLK